MSDSVMVAAYMTKRQAARLLQAMRAIRETMAVCGHGTTYGHVIQAAHIDGRSESPLDMALLTLIVSIDRALEPSA